MFLAIHNKIHLATLLTPQQDWTSRQPHAAPTVLLQLPRPCSTAVHTVPHLLSSFLRTSPELLLYLYIIFKFRDHRIFALQASRSRNLRTSEVSPSPRVIRVPNHHMQSRIFASLQSLVITVYPIQFASPDLRIATYTHTLCVPTQVYGHPLCVPTQEGILKLAVCPLKYTHTHSCVPTQAYAHPLCAHSSIRTPTLCAHSRRHSETCRVPTQVYAHPLCANSSTRTPTLVCPLGAHSRRHSETCRGTTTNDTRPPLHPLKRQLC